MRIRREGGLTGTGRLPPGSTRGGSITVEFVALSGYRLRFFRFPKPRSP